MIRLTYKSGEVRQLNPYACVITSERIQCLQTVGENVDTDWSAVRQVEMVNAKVVMHAENYGGNVVSTKPIDYKEAKLNCMRRIVNAMKEMRGR